MRGIWYGLTQGFGVLLLLLSLVILLCTMTGCGPWMEEARGECISPCGSTLHDSTDCRGLRQAERALIDSVDYHRPNQFWSARYVCQMLDGAHISVRLPGHAGPGWWESTQHRDPQGNPLLIAGVSYCSPKQMIIGTDDWYANAYAHEALHILEGCISEGADHSHWTMKHWDTIGDARVEETEHE